jgi:hypothetical protein
MFSGTLNYHNGLTNTVIPDILQNMNQEAVRVQICCNQEEGGQAIKSINNARKLTTGLLFKSGRAWLGPDILERAIDNKRKREELENAAIQRKEIAKIK